MKIRKKLATTLAVLMLLLSLASCEDSKDQDIHDTTRDTTTDTDTVDTTPAAGTSDLSESTTVIDVDLPVTTSIKDLVKDPSGIAFKLTQESVAKLKPALYKDFAACSNESVLIPGLNQYIVPQGMDYWDQMGWLIISGYISNNKYSNCSVLVAVDLESGIFMGEYFLKNQDGSDHTSHVGGVAVTDKNIFISNGGSLYRIPLSDLLAAEQSGDLKIAETIKVVTNGSFCNYSQGVLWVGEFQYSTNYITDSSHHLKNRDGDQYKAWTAGYILDPGTENELKASAFVDGVAIPDYILSITERIQGMTALSENYIVLSQSYGRTNDSTLFFYNNPLSEPSHSSVNISGVSVPLWFLDNKTGVTKLTAPPMSEGVCAINGMLYTLFESGADYYRNGGGKNPTDRVWVTDVSKLIK